MEALDGDVGTKAWTGDVRMEVSGWRCRDRYVGTEASCGNVSAEVSDGYVGMETSEASGDKWSRT